MQRRQREQEQFSAFEEMIRRQELEKERQRVLLEFAKPATPSPDAPLIPGIQAPSLVSPSAPHSPGDLSSGINHQYNRPPQSTGPPNFDRSLKPGSLFSPGNNSELSFLSHRGLAFWGFKYCPTPALKYLYNGADSPDLLYYLLTPCLVPKHYKNPTLLSAFNYSPFFSPDAMVDALRQLSVPSELCRSFLRLAEANTSRAVETCGILCGKLVRFWFKAAPVSPILTAFLFNDWVRSLSDVQAPVLFSLSLICCSFCCLKENIIICFCCRPEMHLQWHTSSYLNSVVGQIIVTPKMRRNSSSYRTNMILSPWAGYMWVKMEYPYHC